MNPELITRLVGVEWSLCDLYGTLRDLAQEIRKTGVDGSHASSRDLLRAAVLIRRALKKLDLPLTQAALEAERLAPAPF